MHNITTMHNLTLNTLICFCRDIMIGYYSFNSKNKNMFTYVGKYFKPKLGKQTRNVIGSARWIAEPFALRS